MKKYLLFAIAFLSLLGHTVSAQTDATVTAVSASCNGSNGSATATGSGADSYAYKWNNGATTSFVSGLTAGTYTVTVYGTHGGYIETDTVYFEDFQGGIGTWTINIPTGTNGTAKNIWGVNDSCGGAKPGSCSTTRNGDKTLHIHATKWLMYPYIGAWYNAGGMGGDVTSNTAAQSADINTSGASHLKLSFDFLGNGQTTLDIGSVLYSIDGGTTFTVLDPSLRSGSACGNKGLWTRRTYSLPATCNNLTNFLLRFNWKNNNDGWGTDPAVAVNNILLGDSISSTGVTTDSIIKTVVVGNVDVKAGFEVYKFVGGGIYYARNTSTGTGLKYYWEFGDNTYYYGRSPIYAFWTAGYWSVCLTVTDANNCSDQYCDSSFYNAFKTDGAMMTEFRVDDEEDIATGIEETTVNEPLDLYPNPATNILNIPVTDFMPQRIAIYNMQGQLVREEKYTPQLNVGLLPNGLYFVEVKGEQNAMRGRFMKM